jgi:broad specificity phosphatase PhoE
MRTIIAPLTLLFAGLLSACASPGPRNDAPGVTFIVVRHAEKAAEGERDPDLSASGHARARALAERLDDVNLVAAYVTAYRRTHQTAQPAAEAHGLALETYDASQPAAAFASQLRARHRQGTVLVAGHSNTVPDIVSALCACTAEPMPETEYDRLSMVHVSASGDARLVVERYGAPAHAP